MLSNSEIVSALASYSVMEFKIEDLTTGLYIAQQKELLTQCPHACIVMVLETVIVIASRC